MPEDIESLRSAEEATQHFNHWRINFEIRTTDIQDDWAFDELTVAAGPDSREAIQLLNEHIHNEKEYGPKVTAFRVLDIRLLSTADI